jgi:hypothetical protein
VRKRSRVFLLCRAEVERVVLVESQAHPGYGGHDGAGRRPQHKVAAEVRKSRWTGERIARLGFLMGLGWDGNRIAEDPIIASTANNVHRQAQRFGLAFRAAKAVGQKRLPPEAVHVFEAAAIKRGLTQEQMIRLMLLTIAQEPTLIDNILDDGE